MYIKNICDGQKVAIFGKARVTLYCFIFDHLTSDLLGLQVQHQIHHHVEPCSVAVFDQTTADWLLDHHKFDLGFALVGFS